METVEVGRRLARRHGTEPVPDYDADRSLLNYAEAPRQHDWTLRSALVRLAQPDPVRVGELLQAMRRLDAPLHHVARALEKHVVAVDQGGESVERSADAPAMADVRIAALARLVAEGDELGPLLAGYEEQVALTDEERMAIPLLEIAVRFEALSHILARWAAAGPGDPPLKEVDEVRQWAWARMDELGVPVETGPPPGGRGRGRGV